MAAATLAYRPLGMFSLMDILYPWFPWVLLEKMGLL
jgi:hypothetical protein